MRFQPTAYFAILSATAIVSALIAFMAYQRRSTPARSAFVRLLGAVTGYAAFAAMEAAAITLPDKVFWSKLEYVASSSVITFFVLFAQCFTRQKERLAPRQMAWLWVVPAFNVGLVATNEWHRLIWTGFLPSADKTNLIIYQHGPGFYWVMVCVYAYTLTGSFLLAKAALRPSALYRRQAAALLVGSVIPIVGSTFYMLDLTPPGLNITPMSFMVAGLAFSTGLLRFRLFDLIPIARDLLVENLRDGVLVLDVQNRIVDINLAAQRLLNINAHVGKDVTDLLAAWINGHALTQESQFDIVIGHPTPRFVDLRILPLYDRCGRPTGLLITLQDITHRHQIEVELRQANDRLQSQLLEIESLHAKLKEQALRDRLTGLHNRHYLEEALPKELAQAKREGYQIAIVILDLDQFKQVNDSFGHLAGDQLLREFGQLLTRCVRVSDLACRLGGEEFVLVLPSLSAEVAYQRIEQIRSAFQALRVDWAGTEISTTVSGGIAIFPIDGITDEQLLEVADQALYTAKAAGRNRIQRSSRPVALQPSSQPLLSRGD
jgi:diguanylate cyclase (GGDEF)-like protein